MLLVVQAVAVILVVLVKRQHDDSIHQIRPPGNWLLSIARYLKYPLCLYHISYNSIDDVSDTDLKLSRKVRCVYYLL